MTSKSLLEQLQTGRLIAAHRGHRSVFPENTFAAFRDCPSKCDFIELDIRFSKDGVPVVFHDHTLERTSNIQQCGLFAGREEDQLETFHFSELLKLDIGSWFYETDPWQQISCGKAIVPSIEQQSQTILGLGSVLAFIHEHDLGVNVEIKSLHENQLKNAQKLIQLLQDKGVVDQCVVSAFDHDVLRLIKSLDNSVITAALVEKNHPSDDVLNYLQTSGFEGYHIDDALVSSTEVKALQDAGIFVCVYTVNDESRKNELLEMGISAVITDFL